MTFSDIARAIRLHRVVAGVTFLVILAAALAAAILPANKYTASAVGSVQAQTAADKFNFLNTSKYIMPLVAQALSYPAVVDPAKATLSADERSRIGSASVSSVTDPASPILTVSVTSPYPWLSTDYANALATSLSKYKTDTTWEFVDSAPASTPVSPSAPARSLIALGGFVLALIGSLFAALIARAVQRRRLLPEEIRARLGLAVIGMLPRTGRRSLSIEDLQNSPDAYTVESLQRLRINLEIAGDKGTLPKTLCITSLHQGAGKSRITTLIAWTFATAGYRVTVIDADLRMPAQHLLFGLPVSPGLSDAMRLTSPQVFHRTSIDTLAVVPAGSPTGQPVHVVDAALPIVLREAAEHSSLVLIDTPPVTLMAETTKIAANAEAVILVVDAPRFRLEELERVIADLRRSGAFIAGIVLNRVSGRRSASASRYRAYAKKRKRSAPVRKRPKVGV